MENIDDTPIIIEPLSKEEKAHLAKLKKEQPEKDKAAAEEARREAYIRISDPINMMWQRGLKTKQEWLDAVAQVEKDYPIPGEDTGA